MYSSAYSSYGGGGGYGGGVGYSRAASVYSSPYGGNQRYTDYSSRNSSSAYSSYSTSPISRLPAAPGRGFSLPPSALVDRATRHRTVFRHSARDEAVATPENRNMRLRSPSIPRERTRDELIDSIVHTRTREHRAMPGFKSATDYDERRFMRVDCDKVYDGIILGNGDTICNMDYLKGIGVTHVLNTAERHVEVNPAKYPCYGIQYYGFHVDDLPEANISRYFHTTTAFIDKAVRSGGLVMVNCYMGWSRSATCVAAYLMMKHNMKATKALELIRQNRSIRPNAGFLQQLADLENTLSKRIAW